MATDVEPSPLRRTFSWPVMRNSLIVGAVVGTILNAINQGDRMGEGGDPVDWIKVALTYCVPFCVSTWGSYAAMRMFAKRARAVKEQRNER